MIPPVRIHAETLERPRRFGLLCAECFPMLLQLNFASLARVERICGKQRDARVIRYSRMASGCSVLVSSPVHPPYKGVAKREAEST